MYQIDRTVWTSLAKDTTDAVAFRVLGDHTTQQIQARISLVHFGNADRQARKNRSRVAFDRFGAESSEASLLGSEVAQERAAKRKQFLLDNALRLGHLPRPHGPR